MNTKTPHSKSKAVKICLFGIGDVGDEVLGKVSKFLLRHVDGVEVVVEYLPDVSFAFNEERNQYNAKEILKEMESRIHADALKAIGITAFDLFLPMLKYVYGSSQVEGRCALFSLFRLHPRFYSPADADNQRLFDCRVEKTTLHEIAHTFGLTHCYESGMRHVLFMPHRRYGLQEPGILSHLPELFQWMLEKKRSPAAIVAVDIFGMMPKNPSSIIV